MSLDNQRNLKLAIHRDPAVPAVAEQVAAEMNAWAEGFFGRPDDSRLADAARLHDPHLPGARAASRRSPGPSPRRGRLLRVHRRRRALHRQQPRGAAARGRVGGALSAQDPDRRGSGVLARPCCRRSRRTWASPVGTVKTYVLVEQIEACFQLMEIRAALGAALRRLQYRALGLHQQRLGRAGVGRGLRQPEHRRDDDDLRLHAQLRGSRSARGEHARSARPDACCGRAAWSRTSRSGSQAGVEAGMARAVGGRRARAARGRERQMGRPLEDGPHRPARVGTGRPGQSARSRVSRR